MQFPRVARPLPAQPRRSRNSIKVWVIAGVLAQVALFAATQLHQDRQQPTPTSSTPPASARPTPDGVRQNERGTGQQPGPEARTGRTGLAFTAVAGPGCPRDTSRSVRITGVPGRDGWKDAEAPGWKGEGCGNGFLFSELDPAPKTATTAAATAAARPSNTFQWRFTTGLLGRHQCLVAVYVPKSGLAGQRVWYTVTDGFDKDARTVAEFTLDQRMRKGKWVAAPSPATVTGGLVMVQIKDTGEGNTTGDQSMAAGPVRLSCV
ncbi:hypothetical protein AB0I81_24050 [Nonomuraea sp. NPDC050404]|uniref:hypothetical protein n=1 Tax=Nonomuraea sp. NPDC050404 TaxID=3155783 RepID=UPI0033C09183